MIKLKSNFQLPEQFPLMKTALLGRSGMGKTNTAVRLAEQMFPILPFAVIDPQGDWWGMKSDFEVCVFGGEKRDLSLDPGAGKFIAEFFVRERVPIIVDMSELEEEDQIRFGIDFAKRVKLRNRDPVHIFLDEASIFAPQSKSKGSSDDSVKAWSRICNQGRRFGIGITIISQRSAFVNKDLLNSTDPLIIHNLVHSQDLKPLRELLTHHGYDAEFTKDMVTKVSKLKKGEAVIISPSELDIAPTKVKVDRRQSFDSGATPRVGAKKLKPPKKLVEIDLEAFGDKMKGAIEAHKNTDPTELQKQIVELKHTIKCLERDSKPSVDQDAIVKAIAERDRYWREQMELAIETNNGFKTALLQIKAIASQNGKSVEMPKTPSVSKPQSSNRTRLLTSKPIETGDVKLGKCERAVLRAMFWCIGENADKTLISFYAGYSSRSSTFGNACSSLRTKGLAVGWKITDEGIKVAEQYADHKPDGPELREWLRAKLGRAENAILDAALQYDRKASSQELSADSGYSTGSSTFSNALSTLRKVGAITGYDRDGGMIASEVLR